MVQTVHFLHHQNIGVQVDKGGTLLMEPDSKLEAVTGLQVEGTLLQPTEGGWAHAILLNMTGCSNCVNARTVFGEAAEVDVVKGDS